MQADWGFTGLFPLPALNLKKWAQYAMTLGCFKLCNDRI